MSGIDVIETYSERRLVGGDDLELGKRERNKVFRVSVPVHVRGVCRERNWG